MGGLDVLSRTIIGLIVDLFMCKWIMTSLTCCIVSDNIGFLS